MPETLAAKGTTITVRFMDDEIMQGEVEELSFDQANILLHFEEGTSNNEAAMIPLPSVKRVTLAGSKPQEADLPRLSQGKKVAIRFLDGEVLKGYLDGSIEHSTHGITLRLLNEEKDRLETLGIPYTAMKALFYVRSWDSRPPEFEGELDLHVKSRLSSPLVDLVSDMGQLEKLRSQGAISEREFQRKRKRILDNI